MREELVESGAKDRATGSPSPSPPPPLDSFSRWEDHPKFCGWQYVGCAFLSTRRLQKLEESSSGEGGATAQASAEVKGEEKNAARSESAAADASEKMNMAAKQARARATTTSPVPPSPPPSSSTSSSRVLTLKLSRKSMLLIDPARSVQLVPESESDEDLLISMRKVLSSHWLFYAKVTYRSGEETEIKRERQEPEREGESRGSKPPVVSSKSFPVVVARVRLDVFLSSSLWNELNHLVLEKLHVRRVFSRLSLCEAKEDNLAGQEGSASASASTSASASASASASVSPLSDFSENIKSVDKGNILATVFTNLPKHRDLVSKNFYLGQFANVQPVVETDPGLWLLPASALQKIIEYLSSASLGNLAATCRYLHSLCCIQVPGLKLKLYRHQKVALFWMLQREGNPKLLSLSPTAKELKTGDGFSFWMDNIHSKVHFEAPETYLDCKGGFLCDEPGMGKTVTAISLVLRTKSCLPKPPEGCVPVFSCEKGRRGFYEIESSDTVEMNLNKKGARNNRSSSRGRRRLHPSSVSGSGSNSGGRGSNMQKTSDAQVNNRSSSAPGPSTSPGLIEGIKNNVSVVQEQTLAKAKDNKGKGEISWVQCDACKKWRVVSKSMNLDKYAKWFCKMSSDPQLQKDGCEAPEQQVKSEVSNQSTFKTLGYIEVEQGKAKKRKGAKFEEENVQFFISVLKHRRDTWKNIASAIHFLASFHGCQRQLVSQSGLHVPSGRRDPSDYGDFFESLGLARLPGTSDNWIQPYWIGEQFKFDQTSLLLAMDDLLQYRVQYKQMFLSSATLIVVPPHLVAQWKVQFEKCCDTNDLKVFTYDEREKHPLQAHDLAWNYDVVLTTFQMLSSEWTFRRDNSILMQIHWLRIILDEGHSLGSSLSITNKLQMACYIKAERRWVMTGTPTPETVAQGAAHLLPLLKFVHEPQYGLQPTIWQPCIQKPLEAGKLEGAQSLVKLLSRVMIHACKSDLETIPKCHHEICKLDFDPAHAKNYNEFVAIIQRNLLLADWWDDNHHESLMHTSKAKEMATVLRNIRLSCNLAGHMKVDGYDEDIRESLMIVTQMKPKIDATRLAWIEMALRQGAPCERCNEFCRVPIVTPRCAHLLCVDCTGLQSDGCVLCGTKYLMEPGQYSPERSVPVELIELQPSYSQAEFFAPTWMTTASVKTSYLLSRLESLRGKKVIIFSQFQEHLRMIEEQLEKNSVSFSGLYSSALALSAKKMRIVRAKALDRFENEESCQVLLMDGICSHGLDLSFCSNVILMEPIWDIALEQQVVSRAHRMGQRHEVQVETLVMANTIEEQVISVRGLSDADASFSKEVNHIYELRKKKMLLSHLRTVSTRNQSKQGELQIIASPSKKINGTTKPAEGPPIAMGAPLQGEAQDRRAEPHTNEQPAAKKVKFADVFAAEEEGTEDMKILSGFLSQYEEIKSRGLSLIELKATVEGAIHEQIAYQGTESLGRVYFLLVSSYWSGSKSSHEIYLLQKEKHPRYKTPLLFETAREFPDWIFSTLAKALASAK